MVKTHRLLRHLASIILFNCITSITLLALYKKHLDSDAFSGGIEITFVGVVSMQRSSSTFLSRQILAGEDIPPDSSLANAPFLQSTATRPHTHFIALNEIFQTYEQQSGDAWSTDGKELLQDGKRKVKDLSGEEIHDFLLRVAHRRCQFQIGKDLKQSSVGAGNRHQCIVTFKQFAEHLTMEQHKHVWKSLPNFRMIILERNIEDRWKSYWFAQQTGDWDVLGTKEHKQELNTKIGNNVIPQVSAEFKEKHKHWYNAVHEFLDGEGVSKDIPHLFIRYSDVINDPLTVREKALNMIFSPSSNIKGKRKHIKSESLSQIQSTSNRTSGSYNQENLQHSKTGSFANCTNGPDNKKIPLKVDSSLGSGKVTVSCQSFRYKVVVDSFRNVGSIITGVLSSAKEKHRREIIRETWASTNRGVFFLVAGHWNEIKEEFKEKGDMIWIDREEDYLKITEKTASFLQLVDDITTSLNVEYDYALKVDDDAYVALDRLGARLNFISQKWKKADYWGFFSHQVRPTRDPKLKWYVTTDEYPEEWYPSYCQGAGYLLSRKFVHCAASLGHISNSRYMKFEDVFVGILAERCQITSIFDESKLVRVFRSGLLNHDTERERELIRNNVRKVNSGDKWLQKPEMADRIIQHCIFNDHDMVDYHSSYSLQKALQLDTIDVDDEVDFYYDSKYGWCRSRVMSIKEIKTNQVLQVTVTLLFDDGTTENHIFDSSFSGRWRNTSSSLMRYYTDQQTKSLISFSNENNLSRLQSTTQYLKNISLQYYVYKYEELIQGPLIKKFAPKGTQLDHIHNDINAENLVMESLMNHPLKTDDPEKADFFIVPNFIGKFLLEGCRWEECGWFDDAVASLLNHSIFKSVKGKNHVIVSLHWLSFKDRYSAYFPALSRNYKKLQDVTVVQSYDPFGVLNLMKTYSAVDKKIPGYHHLYPFELPLTKAFSVGLMPGNTSTIQQPSYHAFKNSKFFLFYHSRHSDNQPFGFESSKYRDAPFNGTVVRNLPPSSIGHDISPNEWVDHVQSSQFCLVIRGDDPSSHSLAHAIIAGCIPVIVSDDYEEYAGPLKSSLSLKDFCIFIKEADFLLDPLTELQKLLAIEKKNIINLLQMLEMVQRIMLPDHLNSLFVPAFLKELQLAQNRTVPQAIFEIKSNSMKIGDLSIPYKYPSRMEQIFANKTDQGPTIITVVMSKCKEIDQRHAVRNSWARKHEVIFILTDGMWEDVENECIQYGDVVWFDGISKMQESMLDTLLAFSFVELHIQFYDYLLKMDDKGFVYLDDAQSLLGKNSQEYWGICDMLVSANWQKKGVYYEASVLHIRNNSNGDTVFDLIYTEDGSKDTLEVDKIKPHGLGYFISHHFNKCLSSKFSSSKNVSRLISMSVVNGVFYDVLFMREMAKECKVQCNSSGWEWYGNDTLSKKEFIAADIQGGRSMICKFWDAQKERRVGEWTEDNQ